MCRHLAYLGPPVALSSLLFDAPRSLRGAGAAPRTTSRPAGPTPTAGGSPGTPTVAAAPGGTARRPRSGTTTRSRAGPERVGRRSSPRRGSRRRARRSTCANNAPFVSSRWSFSLNGFAFHGDREATTARRALPRPARARSRATPTARCCSRSLLDRLDGGAAPADAAARRHRPRRSRRRRAPEPAPHRRRHGRRHRLGELPVHPSGATTPSSWHRNHSTTTRTGPRCPTARSSTDRSSPPSEVTR